MADNESNKKNNGPVVGNCTIVELVYHLIESIIYLRDHKSVSNKKLGKALEPLVHEIEDLTYNMKDNYPEVAYYFERRDIKLKKKLEERNTAWGKKERDYDNIPPAVKEINKELWPLKQSLEKMYAHQLLPVLRDRYSQFRYDSEHSIPNRVKRVGEWIYSLQSDLDKMLVLMDKTIETQKQVYDQCQAEKKEYLANKEQKDGQGSSNKGKGKNKEKYNKKKNTTETGSGSGEKSIYKKGLVVL
jgi:hypothetical protein